MIGSKAAMESYLGYGGYCRKPVPRPREEEVGRYVEGFAELFELDEKLGG